MSDEPEGYCPVDDPRAAKWGFTRKRFSPDSYLWLWPTEKTLNIAFIESVHPGHGDFGRLVRAMEADGWTVRVPEPFAHMQSILAKWGFVPVILSGRGTLDEPDYRAWVRP